MEYLFLIAFVLDMLIGDPAYPKYISWFWKHPVCYIGDAYKYLEKKLRPWIIRQEEQVQGEQNEHKYFINILGLKLDIVRFVGLCCVLGLASFSYIFMTIISSLNILGVFLAVYFAYAGLATGSLLSTFNEVLDSVENAPLEQAQKSLSQLVSRDTSVLDRAMLRKSLADTLAENVTDAVVAPLFYLIFAGVGGLWAYKSVSTADSMWGYKTEKWLKIGWGGARLDDVLAYIPARLAVLFMYIAYVISGGKNVYGGYFPNLKVIFAQAKGMESPNSGYPMSAGAWLVGACMGGPTVYFGKLVQKPWVGIVPENAQTMSVSEVCSVWNKQKLELLARLVKYTAWVSFVILSLAYVLFSF